MYRIVQDASRPRAAASLLPACASGTFRVYMFLAEGRGSYAGTAAPFAAYIVYAVLVWQRGAEGLTQVLTAPFAAYAYLRPVWVIRAWTGSRGLMAPSSVALGVVFHGKPRVLLV